MRAIVNILYDNGQITFGGLAKGGFAIRHIFNLHIKNGT